MPAPRRPSPRYSKGPDENQPFLEWLHRQLGDALGNSYSSLSEALGAVSASPHAPSHIYGATDAIDGDRLGLDYFPSAYASTPTPPTSTDIHELTSHLRGIDLQFGVLTSSIATKSPLLLPIWSYGASDITLQFTDGHSLLRMNSASARTITVPPNGSVAFDLGTVINVFHEGTGALTYVQGSGVAIRSRLGSLTSAGQYAVQTLIKLDANNWSLSGGLA